MQSYTYQVLNLEEAIGVITERRNWLTERIKAKETVGWDTSYDIRERDALNVVINELSR
jgi:hypothetical protein